MSKQLLFFIAIFLFSCNIWGQRVTVSEDINIGSDYIYDVLGKVDDKILLYRYKGNNHILQVFDFNLWEKQSVELQFEKRNVKPVGLVAGENDFSFFYNYRKKGDQILACRKFGANGNLLDTATIEVRNQTLSFQRNLFVSSKNKRFAAVFRFEKENSMVVHVFDTKSMNVLWTKTYIFDLSLMKRDFREFFITDDGGGILVFKKDDFKIGRSEESLEMFFLEAGTGDLARGSLSFEDRFIIDYKLSFDYFNNKLVIAGLYGDKSRHRSDGYFVLINGEFQFTPFKKDLYQELEKNSKREVNALKDFKVADIIVREDGGILLLAEMQRVFTRLSTMRVARSQNFADYYNEDILVFSIHADGKPHWEKVLRKKQFSQDDGGSFSSFFVFKSPQELRFIFNDEIRQDNTVSEYIINPLGENERNIVMNTEYQKLRLRFPEAIQISARDFIVPSEKNTKFNLVKVSF